MNAVWINFIFVVQLKKYHKVCHVIPKLEHKQYSCDVVTWNIQVQVWLCRWHWTHFTRADSLHKTWFRLSYLNVLASLASTHGTVVFGFVMNWHTNAASQSSTFTYFGVFFLMHFPCVANLLNTGQRILLLGWTFLNVIRRAVDCYAIDHVTKGSYIYSYFWPRSERPVILFIAQSFNWVD